MLSEALQRIQKRYSTPSVRHAAFRLAAGWLGVSLLGCTTTTSISVNDKSATIPSLRAEFNLGEHDGAASEPAAGSAIEVVFLKTRGGADQWLKAGAPPVILDGTSFSGPQQLRNDFDFSYADLAFRKRGYFGESSLGYEWSAGVGRGSLGLTVRSPTQEASRHRENFGVGWGLGFVWRLGQGSSLHARGSFFGAPFGIGFSRSDVFFAQALGENLVLRAGYAKLSISGSAAWGEQHYDLTCSGPMLELGMRF